MAHEIHGIQRIDLTNSNWVRETRQINLLFNFMIEITMAAILHVILVIPNCRIL